MKKLLIIGLAVMTIGSFNACKDVDWNNDTILSETLESKSSDQNLIDQSNETGQWEANQKYSKLISSFGTFINRFGNETPEYPDFYGGAYFSEQGKFTIYIHGDFEEGIRAVTSVIGKDNIEFKKADHSYKYLCNLSDEISDYVLKNKESDVVQMISSFGVMDNTNTLEVRLIGLDEEKADRFSRAVLNKKAITFKNSMGRIKLKADLRPGCIASADAFGSSYGSFAFAAKRISDGTIGMVSSGHVFSVGQTLYQSGTAIGTCSISQRSGSVDAAFIPISNLTSYPVSNFLCSTTNLLSTSTLNPLLGTNIHLEGAVTNHSQGVVTGTNETIIDEFNITLTNLTAGDYTATHGDSGAITYTLDPSFTRYTAGVNVGGDGTYEYYCKADIVLSDLGLERY